MGTRVWGRLKPVGLVHYVLEFTALAEADAVLDEELGAAVIQVGACARTVGRDDDVGHCPEGVARGQRLNLEGWHNMPAIDLLGANRPALWGLTYRMVAQMAGFAGVDLPERL